MVWTGTNPVSIGAPTRKLHYDRLWDNCDYLLATREDTDTDSIAAFIADDHYKMTINSKDNFCSTTTGVSLGWHIGSTDLFDLSQYGKTLHKCTKVSVYPDTYGFGGGWDENADFDNEDFDSLNEYDITNQRFLPTETGYYLFIVQMTFGGCADGDGIGVGIARHTPPVTSDVQYSVIRSTGGANDNTVSVMAIMHLTAGAYYWCPAGYSFNANNVQGDHEYESFFHIHRLS